MVTILDSAATLTDPAHLSIAFLVSGARTSGSISSEVRNDLFDRTVGLTRGRPRWFEGLWYICKVVFFLPPVPWPSSLRRRLLIRFGARVGKNLYIRPGVNVHFPWKLEVGSHCWIGDDTVILNLAPVTLGDRGTGPSGLPGRSWTRHPKQDFMAYNNAPITIGNGCWIARAPYVGPGVSIGDYAVVAAGAIVVRDVPGRTVVGGNPAAG